MRENAERIIKVGLKRDPKTVFDQVDSITACMVRNGWRLNESFIEDGLGNIHLFFDREIGEMDY
jgi:hypothetical protein